MLIKDVLLNHRVTGLGAGPMGVTIQMALLCHCHSTLIHPTHPPTPGSPVTHLSVTTTRTPPPPQTRGNSLAARGCSRPLADTYFIFLASRRRPATGALSLSDPLRQTQLRTNLIYWSFCPEITVQYCQ